MYRDRGHFSQRAATSASTRVGVESTPLDAAGCGSYKLNHMVQFHESLDRGFGALADGTRRGILERLGRGDASITELAQGFDMTLTGIKKHVQILEEAGLLVTEKVGRVRTCRLGPRRLARETNWIAKHRQMVEQRLDHLDAFLERTKETKDE